MRILQAILQFFRSLFRPNKSDHLDRHLPFIEDPVEALLPKKTNEKRKIPSRVQKTAALKGMYKRRKSKAEAYEEYVRMMQKKTGKYYIRHKLANGTL